MATSQPAQAKPLRLFASLGPENDKASPVAASAAAVTNPQERLDALAAGTASKWSPFYAASAAHDMRTTALLMQCISLGHYSKGPLAGFDRDVSRAFVGSDGSKEVSADGQLAAALAEQFVPGWRALTHTPGWRWHMQNLMESPCFGVPGICRYTAARTAWLQGQMREGIEADACRQVVILRSGFSCWSHSMSQPGVQFYEVDSHQTCQHKRELLDEVAPGWRRAARRPRFAEVDFSGGLKTLITQLTGAGFDPSLRCCIVAEGLLAYMSQEQIESLITDLSALCAPGSRLLFDFLHADALEGSGGNLPGFASLAEAAANKGCPLRSGMRPAFSAMVKLFQPHRFRVMQVLPPHEVAAFWRQSDKRNTQQLGPGGKHAAAAAATTQGKLLPSVVPTAGPAASGALPYVPEFFGMAAVVKIDSRLLLRRAISGSGSAGGTGQAAAASLGSGVSGWMAAGAAAAMSSPSCIVRSFAFLLWGSGRLSTPAAAAVPTEASPLLLPAAPERQLSAEFTIAAAPSQPQPASLTSVAQGSDSELPVSTSPSTAARSASGQQAEESSGLDRALSILPRGRVPDGAVRSATDHDGGHLLLTSGSGVAAEVVGTQAVATRQAMAEEASWSFVSFSNFF